MFAPGERVAHALQGRYPGRVRGPEARYAGAFPGEWISRREKENPPDMGGYEGKKKTPAGAGAVCLTVFCKS